MDSQELPVSRPSNEESMVNAQKFNMSMMETVASDAQTLDDIKMLTSDKVTNQLKVFLVAQARNELMRVVKLTKFLDKLESKFMSKADDLMMTDDLSLKQYGDIISIITGLLARSNEIVSKVLRDDSLMTILNTTIYSTDTSVQTSTVVKSLKDPQSRERVRAVINSILVSTQNYNPDADLNTVNNEVEGEIHNG